MKSMLFGAAGVWVGLEFIAPQVIKTFDVKAENRWMATGSVVASIMLGAWIARKMSGAIS
jgi:hypothetical protein